MPNLTLPLNDTQYSVERPVIYDIVRQLLDITQISHKTPIMFYGDENKAAQKNSALAKDALAENYWPYNEKVFIEVDEDYEKDRILSTAIRRPENIFIFKDDALGLSVKPVYSSSDVNIQFKYRASDKNQATRWRNEMRTRISMMRDINLHELVYHYHFPGVFVTIIKEIHRLRENVAGYGESFEEYFTKYLTINASLINNLAGNGEIWAVSERQIRVQGYFDFDDTPDKPEKEGDHDNWTASVGYRFKYDKPIECHMKYPMLVHQQLLDQRFWSSERAYRLEDQNRVYTLSAGQFNEFESDAINEQYRSNKGITVPEYDEFVPASILPATLRVFTAMSSLEETDLYFLFNLNELGDIQLDPEVLEFIRTSEYSYLGKDYASIFCLCLYEGRYAKKSGTLYVDSDLNVRSNVALNLRLEYHVRLSLVADFVYLDKAAISRLSKHPSAAIKLLSAINSGLSECGGQKDLMKNRLSWKDIDRLKLLGDFNFLNLSDSELDKIAEFLINQAISNGLRASLDPTNPSSPIDPFAPGTTTASQQGAKSVPLSTLTRDQQIYWIQHLIKTSNTAYMPRLNQTMFVVIPQET